MKARETALTWAAAREDGLGLGPAERRMALVLGAFACIYLIWGSTYLAIRVALDHLPPFLMASMRFLAAGVPFYAVLRLRGTPAPRPREWAAASGIGILLLLGGNGGVCFAEQSVASGTAALVIASVPLWVTALHWALFGGPRPGRRAVAGIGLGLAGVALLVGGTHEVGQGLGFAALVGSALSWSLGTLASRRAPLPPSPMMATAMEMIGGGAALFLVALGRGEAASADLASVPWRGWAAMAYLVAFGSILAFTAYVWLLRVVPASRVATYAYVNPVVALGLGWWLGGEALTTGTLVAAAGIVMGVVMILGAPQEEGGRR